MLVNLLIQHLKTNENKAYYYTAKYKGIGKSKLYFFHQLPNALLPALSYLVQSIPALLSGSVVIELIFTIPGMGFSIFNAIQQGDHVAISFIFLLMGTITLVSFLLADVIAKWFNPKNEAIW
jgi:ABC-type dipeptide/oligopeptide/nickel transport system permease component